MTPQRLNKLFDSYFKVSVDHYIISFEDLDKLKKDLLTSKVKATREQIDFVYKLYPSKCLIRGASSGKSLKNKIKIGQLIDDVGYDKLVDTIDTYVKDCVKNKTYMMNFKTFLNNLPDYGESAQEVKVLSDEEKYLTEEERKLLDNNVKQELIFKRKKQGKQ